jgi:hypothetical protein
MGCDIHLCIEHGNDPDWRSFAVGIHLLRLYSIFGRLAGVRSDEPPLIAPRGFPIDAAPQTKAEFAGLSEFDAHTPSWLTLAEWKAAMRDGEGEPGYQVVSEIMEDIERRGKKARVVFWFDN